MLTDLFALHSYDSSALLLPYFVGNVRTSSMFLFLCVMSHVEFQRVRSQRAMYRTKENGGKEWNDDLCVSTSTSLL
jgi:hypothetical protein